MGANSALHSGTAQDTRVQNIIWISANLTGLGPEKRSPHRFCRSGWWQQQLHTNKKHFMWDPIILNLDTQDYSKSVSDRLAGRCRKLFKLSNVSDQCINLHVCYASLQTTWPSLHLYIFVQIVFKMAQVYTMSPIFKSNILHVQCCS